MSVRIRLARYGCKHRPFYRVVTSTSTSPRDGKQIETLGFYNPLPGEDVDGRMKLNFERIRYWLSVGAQPSEAVKRILIRAGVIPRSSDGSPIAQLSESFDTKESSEGNEDALDLLTSIGFPAPEPAVN
uniref:Ribosomal protein S16 n=1 Tax=Delphinium staphisagria TaxID=104301 RepID=A0A6G6CIH9_DELST|nr:ribosomal protein S16 [Staphisagria macrosperma]